MRHSLATLVACSLLGVIAVAALTTGVFFLLGAWAGQQVGNAGSTSNVGVTAAVIIGVLTIGYAAFAGFAARDQWLARPRGFVYGLVVAVVAVLAAVVALLEGRTQESEALLYIAAGLGVGTTVSLLVAAWVEPRPTGYRMPTREKN